MRVPIIDSNRTLQTGLITKEKINSDILNISNECRFEVEKLLKNDIYSIYLYGGHAQNTSNSIYSDLDLLLFFNKTLSNNQKQDILFLEHELTSKYKERFSYIGFDVAEPSIYTNTQSQVYGLLTKSLGFQLSKNGMENRLENPILSNKLAFQLNNDFKARIEKKFLEFINEDDLFKKKLASRWICKKLLRTSFGLLADKVDFFENDISELIKVLIQYFPENKDIIINIGNNINNPTDNILILKNIIDQYLPWIEDKWSEKFLANKYL